MALIPGSLASPASPSTPVEGANTFSSLKSMFKIKSPSQKRCKICGEQFTPKTPGVTNPKQKLAAMLAAKGE